MKYDVITFGSASQDIFVKSKEFLPLSNEIFTTGKGICLNLGAKIEAEEIFLFSGGGGTNTAVTFANQELKAGYCGMIGDDTFGSLILQELKSFKIETRFIKKTKEKKTNLSVFFVYPGADRTTLVYRSASDFLQKQDIQWREIKNTKWFYLAPFSGELAKMTMEIIDFAKKNNIKIAFNPGYTQLNIQEEILKDILEKVDVLILNREEASQLTKIPYQEEKEIFMKIDELTKGICIMTRGEDGVSVSDGKYLYSAKALSGEVVEKTGAGDAFGAGFISGLIEKNDIIHAIQLGMANAASCISKWGAKEGLLKKGESFNKVNVEKSFCQPNGLCQEK